MTDVPRFYRIPYIYIPTAGIKYLYTHSGLTLRGIHSIHHDIPSELYTMPAVKHYMYHASFVLWVHDCAAAEMRKRGGKTLLRLAEGTRELKSLGLDYFLPPTDVEIADDVVSLLDTFGKPWASLNGCLKLPLSYLELAKEIHGYSPNERAQQGVDTISRHHRDNDAGWYSVQG